MNETAPDTNSNNNESSPNTDARLPFRKETNSVNMTTVNPSSDMRSNSIAALRIKAKEHLENISKGLTIV
jgi:hypothetical protein